MILYVHLKKGFGIMEKEKDFQGVYSFTTENNHYLTQMDIEGKNILTLGSSCDQAFNSLLLGANEVTIFDINQHVKDFYELKRKLIFQLSREKLVEEVINSKKFFFIEEPFSLKQLEQMDLYLRNDENYQKLRQILERKVIKFITGNIFDIKSSIIGDKKYDRVILSNVLQYHPKKEQLNEQDIYKIYNNLSYYLNENAIVQLYYLYGSIYPKGFTKIVNEFDSHDLTFEKIKSDEQDSVILVKKKTF